MRRTCEQITAKEGERMVKGVIFDMDGVLVDSEPFYHAQRLEYLRRMDYAPRDTIHRVGSNEPEIWAALVPESEHLRQELLMGYHAFRQLHPTPYASLLNPGALELLAELRRRGIKTGIASSSVWESVDQMLETTGASFYIDHAVSGEDCAAYKPDPEVYLKALDALELKPDEAIAVEDSPTGIAAARNAGLKVYALRQQYEPPMDQSAATAVIENLKDILKYL